MTRSHQFDTCVREFMRAFTDSISQPLNRPSTSRTSVERVKWVRGLWLRSLACKQFEILAVTGAGYTRTLFCCCCCCRCCCCYFLELMMVQFRHSSANSLIHGSRWYVWRWWDDLAWHCAAFSIISNVHFLFIISLYSLLLFSYFRLAIKQRGLHEFNSKQ